MTTSAEVFRGRTGSIKDGRSLNKKFSRYQEDMTAGGGKLKSVFAAQPRRSNEPV